MGTIRLRMTNDIFGREDILTTLQKRIHGFRNGYRQNVALLSRPLMGCSSILRALFCALKPSSSFLPVFITFSGRSLRQIIGSLTSCMLSGFLDAQGVSVEGGLDCLIARAQAFLPNTTARIKIIYSYLDKGKNYAALSEALELPQDIYSEGNIRCLLCLDNFEELQRLAGENIFEEWGKKIITQKNTMYIIASSSYLRAKEILSRGLSLLFGNFEVLDIRPYGVCSSSAFVCKKLKQAISKDYIKLVVDLSAGIPFYLDRICRELSREVAVRRLMIVDEETFIQTFEGLLWDDWGVLNRLFLRRLSELLPQRQYEDYLTILVSLSLGYTRSRDIAVHLGRKEKNIQQRLSRFYSGGLIVRNGDFLYFADKMFAFWFRTVYTSKMECDCGNMTELRNGFRKELSRIIREFFSVLHKPIAKRIEELFELFHNEVVHIGRKKWTLSSFKDVRLLRPKDSNFQGMILARSPQAFWLVAINNGPLSDRDISRFVGECRKYGNQRLQKRIIITFGALETNAKLRALEEKVTTWETENLNSLFWLYNRPGIFV